MHDDHEVPEVRYGADVPPKRRTPRWSIVLSVATLGSLLIGMLVLMPLFGRPSYEVGLFDANQVGEAVMVRGRRVATGEKAFLPDSRMVAVGRTDEGYLVYVDSHKGHGGGGGGMPERTADLTAYDELWVRTAENAYTRIELAGSTKQ
jgi:hypothetical protein